MKNYLVSNIEAKPFFKRYIMFWIPLLLLGALAQWGDESLPLLSALASLAESYISLLLGLAFFIYAIIYITFKDRSFGFSGSLGKAAPKFLKWYLLTIITLGIYSPWFLRNIIDYYLNNLDCDGKSGELLSRPGTLLKYLLLTLYLPVIVLLVIYSAFALQRSYGYMAGPTIIVVVAIFLVIVPFLYFYFAWILQIRFGEYKTAFRRSIGDTAGFLIPQILLCIVTLFIYYPAAMVKIYRFLAEGTDFYNEQHQPKGGFGFDGTAGKGFCLLWGQGLLTLITIGIYGPWAISKLTNWFVSNTYIES